MDNETLLVVIGVVVAVIGGYFVARRSDETEKVRGSMLAQLAHYVASAGMAGIPAALVFFLVITIFTPGNLLDMFIKYVLVNLAVVVGALLVYGAIEPDPEEKPKNALPPLD